MADFTNSVLQVDDYVFKDLAKCCEFFISDNIIFDGKNHIGNEIWDTPAIASHLIKNEANKNVIKNIFEMICIFEKSIPTSGIKAVHDILEKSLACNPTRGRSGFLFNQVNKHINCEESRNILRYIKKYGNPSLSIGVTREPVNKPTIKFSNLPRVKLRIAQGFVSRSNIFQNCSFFMIDGAASSTSELTSLMEKSFIEKNKTYFLVCKSFNSDVLFYLKENYDRRLTNIIPVEYGFDLESINSLADIVSVAGGLPFSPMLGDIISAADFSRLGKSDECKFDGENLIIKTRYSNSSHRKKIARKIEQSNSEEEKRLLTKRMSGLTSNTCKIILPKAKNYNSIERNIKYSALLLKEMTSNLVMEYKFRKQKFYISSNAYKIQNELENKIEQLLKTKIFLPRR
tara:strand:+ start:19844 stop:21046 length:1203 start_codon:yes stop_codon:yes gene_type:complete